MSGFVTSTHSSEDHAYLLSFLFRKIGKDTSWEGMKKEVFDLFLSHKLLFPWLEHELPLRCVTEGRESNCVMLPFTTGCFDVELALLEHICYCNVSYGPFKRCRATSVVRPPWGLRGSLPRRGSGGFSFVAVSWGFA